MKFRLNEGFHSAAMTLWLAIFLGGWGTINSLPHNHIHNDNVWDKIEKANHKVAGLSHSDELSDADVDRLHLLTQTTKRHNKRKRRSVAEFHKVWPKHEDGFVYVPYDVQQGTPYSVESVFLEAIEEFNTNTCVRFVRAQNATHYVLLMSHHFGCFAQIGYKQNGLQFLSLNEECLSKGVAIHEILHTLSFRHTMARIDRDNYVFVNFSNIHPDNMDQFEKHQPGEAIVNGIPFDEDSVMMYSRYALAVNDNYPTVIWKDDPDRVNRAVTWSKYDIIGVNRLYECWDYEYV